MAAWSLITETLPVGLLLIQTLVGLLHPIFAASSKGIQIHSRHPLAKLIGQWRITERHNMDGACRTRVFLRANEGGARI